MHLFWERGFEATSIQDLVDRLGIINKTASLSVDERRLAAAKHLRPP